MRLTFLRISSAERVVMFNAQFLVWITLHSLYLSHRATICTLILIKETVFSIKQKVWEFLFKPNFSFEFFFIENTFFVRSG